MPTTISDAPELSVHPGTILERELSRAENELTDLGKPRRALIFEKHRARLEGLY